MTVFEATLKDKHLMVEIMVQSSLASCCGRVILNLLTTDLHVTWIN